jgi:hypothetical protein
MILCEVCGNWSDGLSSYCEWCGVHWDDEDPDYSDEYNYEPPE